MPRKEHTSRRNVLKLAGTALATTCATGVSVANSRNDSVPIDFDPSDRGEVLDAFGALKQLSEDVATDIWVDDLSRSQTDAIVDLVRDELETEFVSVTEGSLSAGTSATYNTEDITEKAVGGVDGAVGKEYVFEHQLFWEYNGSDYRNVDSDQLGDPTGLFASYNGPVLDDVDPFDSYFEAKQAGRFAFDPPEYTDPVEVTARIYIEGRQSGSYTVTEKRAPLF
jgi:hypothetical protein